MSPAYRVGRGLALLLSAAVFAALIHFLGWGGVAALALLVIVARRPPPSPPRLPPPINAPGGLA